jgi:hypothetical protein
MIKKSLLVSRQLGFSVLRAAREKKNIAIHKQVRKNSTRTCRILRA